MAENNEGDLEIVLKDDTAPEKEQEIVLADDKKSEAKPDISIDEGIKELKISLERERLARVEAERRAQQQSAQAHLMTREVEDNQRQMLSSALEMVNSERVLLRNQYAEAMSQGNYSMVAEINDRMNDLAVKANVIEQGRDAMQSQQNQQKQPVQQQPYGGDPVEAFAAKLTPRSAAWVREHPEFVRDQKLNRKMLAAHELAVADGIDPDSDEYFNHVEGTLKVGRNEANGQEEAPLQRKAAPPSAPVSRSGMNNDGSRPNVVRLNAEQREMASMMGMTPEEYARNMRDLKREGRMN